MRRCWNWYTSWSKKPVPWHESSSLSRRTIDIGSVTEVVERYGLQHHWRNPTWVQIPPKPPNLRKKEGDLYINHINPTLNYSDTDKISWVAEQNNVKIFILDKNTLEWPAIKQLIFGGME